MPQFDPASFATQIFWLVVTFSIFYFVVTRFALPGLTSVIDRRQKQIEDDLARAENLKREAETLVSAYEKALAEARQAAHDHIQKAVEEIGALGAQREASLGETLAVRTREAEARIGAARDKALADIPAMAASLVSSATRKLAGMAAEPADVEREIAAALAEADHAE